ncbi:MAG: arginyltransferase [Candidatus Hydrogenedentes bacterium]|nr:arginyltransferase [Candidatus Hydrogenedentota bacterium]
MKLQEIMTGGLVEMAYLGHGRCACPYLPGREMRLLYLDGIWVEHIYDKLLDAGFRRSGTHVYRPDCLGCNECKVLRVPIDTFRKTKEQRRVWNQGIKVFNTRVAPVEYSDEKLDLQRRYLAHQHDQPDYELPDEDSYRRFLVDSCLGGRTRELQLWKDGQLVGLGVIDELPDALSTVNFFYDPSVAKWSPGTFSALAEIELARQWGKSYYYLGYYIAACKTMNYKSRFKPNQIKDCNAAWDAVDDRIEGRNGPD